MINQAQRELLVARILAGCLRCKVKTEDGQQVTVVLRKPPLEQIYVAHELYFSYMRELEEAGCMNENEMIEFMIREGFWSVKEQETLDTMIKNIEEFKVKLYQLTFKANEKRAARKALDKSKEVATELSTKKQVFNHLTSTGAASLLKAKYLIAMSAHHINGEPLYTEDSFWQSDPFIFEQLVDYYLRTRLDDATYRDIARNEPWRSIWNTKKSEGSVFGTPAANLSDEQRTLVVWSGIYDSIYEHPECPPDEVVADDDILDGWMILQRRKRNESSDKNKAESLIENEKIRTSGEVFLPADTIADAKKIDSLNDQHAQMLKRQRLSTARKKGVVHEAEMPDSAMEISAELNRMMTGHMRGKE